MWRRTGMGVLEHFALCYNQTSHKASAKGTSQSSASQTVIELPCRFSATLHCNSMHCSRRYGGSSTVQSGGEPAWGFWNTLHCFRTPMGVLEQCKVAENRQLTYYYFGFLCPYRFGNIQNIAARTWHSRRLLEVVLGI